MISGKATKVLVLGVTGMLGNAVLRVFAKSAGFDVMGSVRDVAVLKSLQRIWLIVVAAGAIRPAFS